MTQSVESVDLVVLGSGPGGYTAAFRAADLGLSVALVERYNTLGGVCLNVGCIPSKALLHTAEVIESACAMDELGVSFGAPRIDLKKLRVWKNSVIKKLTTGLAGMAKQRKVTVVQGVGEFAGPNRVTVTHEGKSTTVEFKQAIIAVGSQPVSLPFIPDDPRVMDSTGALELEETACRLLVLGGGIIGLEMATVYHALGADITVVEMMDQLIPGADADLVKPLHQRMKGYCKAIHLKTKVVKVEAKADALWVTFEGDAVPEQNPQPFDRVLVSVGRRPNGKLISADKAGVTVDERGFIPVDKQMRTNVPHIFAIGDVAGMPMLAHKASYEAVIAAEVAAGHSKRQFDARCIPSVAYTDPEVAWVGLTENEAKQKGIAYEKGVFPWMASGRAIALGRTEGFTKLLCDKNGTVIGAGIVGVGAGDLISEVALAIEMGCDAEDLAATIHPHPTTAESVKMAAEVYEGTITDLYLGKKKEKK